MNHRNVLLTAGILGATGVALGAFGAHGLREALTERGMTVAWETGARYQLLHAVALVGLAAWLQRATGAADKRARWAATCWTAGVILFSGSLYLIALGGPRWLGPVTPIGGILLMLGWLFVVGAALTKQE